MAITTTVVAGLDKVGVGGVSKCVFVALVSKFEAVVELKASFVVEDLIHK